MPSVSVRYVVDDVEAAIGFYVTYLGFTDLPGLGDGSATLVRGDLRLLLDTVGGGAATGSLPGGALPHPGGWNRFSIEVTDLDRTVRGLRTASVRFRNEIVEDDAGRQVIIEDPSGNPVELFQPAGAEDRLTLDDLDEDDPLG